VSSAYLHIEFPGTAATRSPAVTTYAAGPTADPHDHPEGIRMPHTNTDPLKIVAVHKGTKK